MIHRCFIYITWNVSYHFVSCEWRTLILAFRCIVIWTRLANVNIWVKFWSRHSEVFKIYTKYLSFLVYNQVYNLFVCTLCCCLTSFQQWNWEKPLRNFPSLDMTRVTWKSRKALENIDLNQMRNRYVSGVLQNEPSDFRSFDRSLREC